MSAKSFVTMSSRRRVTVQKCVVLGGGGHAKVLLDCLRTRKDIQIVGILDVDRKRWGTKVLGVKVLGGDAILRTLVKQGITCFIVGVGGSKDNGPRRKLYELGKAAGLRPVTVIHPTAIISPAAQIGDGCQLLPGCVVNADAELGENVIVNSGAIVEHDCVMGSHVHIATGAKLCSTVTVGDGAHIGAGATIRQCISIGPRAIVGAGAVVVKVVVKDSTVTGIPALVRDASQA